MFASALSFLRDLWILVRPYWRSEERWRSGALLVAIIALNLGTVYLNVLFNEWNNLFYNALQEFDWDGFVHQFIRFGALAVAFIAVAVYRVYLRQMLQIRWRRWLTQRYIGHWLEAKAYYRLQLVGGTDNPDQRIADDIGGFIGQTLVLCLGLLESIVTLGSFAAILWRLSGSLEVGGISIPGYMLWAAILYAVFGTWIAHLIGKRLIPLNYQQQQFEADFRFSLVRLRENAEGVALYGGEAQEAEALSQRFGPVVANWWAIMRRQKLLTWFTAGYGQGAVVFPFIVAAPRYFSKSIHLGGLMQIASAFGQVQGALSWFVDAYTGLAEWKASVDRLIGFERAVLAVQVEGSGFEHSDSAPGQGLVLEDLVLALPDGTVLLENWSHHFAPASQTLIAGPSGCGKSTLMRAMAGIWPHGSGHITRPAGQNSLFLPQKPYLPIASLRDVVSYPGAAGDHDDKTIIEVLMACGLGRLGLRLDDVNPWGQQLSPGEQQRLAFARALLARPHWLFLDEASSNLDEKSEAHLYGLLIERLPKTALISVAHRPNLVAFHPCRVEFPTRVGSAG